MGSRQGGQENVYSLYASKNVDNHERPLDELTIYNYTHLHLGYRTQKIIRNLWRKSHCKWQFRRKMTVQCVLVSNDQKHRQQRTFRKP